jgi:hypothetical protein
MGCDESVGEMVARAILTLFGMDWVGMPGAPSKDAPQQGKQKQSSTKSPVKNRAGGRPTGRGGSPAAVPERALNAGPATQRPAVNRAVEENVNDRVEAWRTSGNTVAIGNLGEQVAMRALARVGYEVLASQSDLKGALPDIVGKLTRMNPEDFVAVTPDNRFTTVNVKATASETTSKITPAGDLSTPSMSKGQNLEQYYSTRAEFLSPLDEGKAFGQVMKVDLVNKQAQIFEISDEGRLSAVGKPINVLADIAAVCALYRDTMPAPGGPNLATGDAGGS